MKSSIEQSIKEKISTIEDPEMAKIRKSKGMLMNECYNTPQTSLLQFHFEPQFFSSSDSRLRHCSIKYSCIEGKDVYVLDDFFPKEEAESVRDFSKKASFSRNSYGSPEAIEKGEKPALSMNGKERWHFFSQPPKPIREFYKLLATMAEQIDAEISTLPWELCDRSSNGSPSVIGNFLEEASFESMELGKHPDCDPKEGIAFGIPILYSKENAFYENRFENGEEGRPWIVSMMLYVTAEDYLPQYCMGTAFYGCEETIALCTDCLNMRLVLFDTDLIHTIEASKIPESTKTWRVSYVFKLVFNPKLPNQSMKRRFFEWIRGLSGNFSAVFTGDTARI